MVIYSHLAYKKVIYSAHALEQMQRRGISRKATDLILEHGDMKPRVRHRGCLAKSISDWKCEELIRSGYPPAAIARARGIRLIFRENTHSFVVLTAEHNIRRRKTQGRPEEWRRRAEAKRKPLR